MGKAMIFDPIGASGMGTGGGDSARVRELARGAEGREHLAATGEEETLSAWWANWSPEERQRSSIYPIAERMVRPFPTPGARGQLARRVHARCAP